MRPCMALTLSQLPSKGVGCLQDGSCKVILGEALQWSIVLGKQGSSDTRTQQLID